MLIGLGGVLIRIWKRHCSGKTVTFFSSSTVVVGMVSVIPPADDPVDISRGIGDDGQYINEFAGRRGNHIIVGGRMVGKTSMLARKAIELAADGQHVAVLVPMQDMASQFRHRVLSILDLSEAHRPNHKNEIQLRNGTIEIDTDFDYPLRRFDSVLIDEASELQNAPQRVDTMKHRYDTVAMAYTPKPQRSLLDGFAQYNTAYATWHIPSSASLYMSDDKVEQQYAYMPLRRFQAEIEAKYWDGERHIEPNHDYS